VRGREQPLPAALQRPVFGQVNGDASGVTGDATGHVDQMPADGGWSGQRTAPPGEGGGGAGSAVVHFVNPDFYAIMTPPLDGANGETPASCRESRRAARHQEVETR
jgi:hypothetical protein